MQFEDDKNRHRKQLRSAVPNGAIDGFISHKSPRQPPQFVNAPKRTVSAGQGRLINDFNRPSGYYSRSQSMRSAGPRFVAAHTAEANVHSDSDFAKGSRALLNSGRASDDSGKGSHRFSWRKVRRWSLKGGATVFAAVLIIAGFLLIRGFLQLHNIFKGGGTAVALQSNVDPNQLKGIGDGRVNILLLGVGGPGHDGPDLTDTMMVVSVDPINDKVALISVPRDLWVKEPNDYISDYGKINAAYESGKYQYLGYDDASNANQKAVDAGFKTADETVSSVLGIPIQYDALVDFQAFSQAINTVGGVTVNVPTELYDPTIEWQNNYNPVIAKAGLQTMNGSQALLYARSRETTTDFARATRQRAILVALKNKILSAGTISNPWKINQLLSAFGSNVRTNLSLSDSEALYGILKKVGNSNIQSIGLAGNSNASSNLITTGMLDGQSVDEPVAGLFDYSQIQSYVRNTAKDGYLAKENAKITVLNGTTVNGAASQTAAMLKSYGFNVGTVADAPTSDYQKTTLLDFSHGQDKYTKHYLEQRLGVSAKKATSANSIKPNGAKFVIIVGNDEATATT